MKYEILLLVYCVIETKLIIVLEIDTIIIIENLLYAIRVKEEYTQIIYSILTTKYHNQIFTRGLIIQYLTLHRLEHMITKEEIIITKQEQPTLLEKNDFVPREKKNRSKSRR